MIELNNLENFQNEGEKSWSHSLAGWLMIGRCQSDLQCQILA